MEILKLFGVEIPVHPRPEYSSAPACRRQSPPLPQEKRVPESLAAADVITSIRPSSATVHEEDVHNPPPPSEYSSTPSCSCPVALLPPDDVQEKRVPESQAAAAAAADVITGNLPCSSSSGDGTKIPMNLKPSKKRKFDGSHDYVSSSSSMNPEPLQSFPPMNHQEVRPTINGRKNKKAKSDEKKPAAEKKSPAKKSKKKTSIGNEEEAAVPLEEIPGLMEIINNSGNENENENENGSSSSSSSNTRRPVFLYRKKLEESDVNSGLNRLMVNREEKMLEFLTEEERKDVLTPRDQEAKPRGFELTGVDQNGNLYKLCYKLWASLNKTAINKQWNKLISQHNAKKGDWVEIWGYRVINNNNDENENGPRFVINFRKTNDPNMVDDKAAAGSSSMQ
ncbi:hypothetical protein ACP275_02G131000 [Erythranthe tilingii]